MKCSFIKLGPARVLFLSFLFYSFIREYGGMIYEPVSTTTWLFVSGSLIFFMAGYFTIHSMYYPILKNSYSQSNCCNLKEFHLDLKYVATAKRAFRALKFLAIVNVIVSIVNLFGIIDTFTGFSAADITTAHNLRTMMGIRNSFFGMLSILTNGFPVIGVAFFILEKKTLRLSHKEEIKLLILLTVNILLAIILGGRNEIAFSLVFVLLVCGIRSSIMKQGIFAELTRTTKILMLTGFMACAVWMLFVFFIREQASMRDYLGVVNNLSLFNIKVQLDWLEIPQKIKIIYTMLVYYITHSFNELDLLLAKTPSSAPYWGGYNFFPVVLFFKKYGFHLTDINNILQSLPRRGVYFGLLGALYLDFGYIGTMIFLYLFGIFVGYAWLKAIKSKQTLWVLFSAYNLLILMLSPIYSSVSIGNGFSIFLAIFFMLFLEAFLWKALRRSNILSTRL